MRPDAAWKKLDAPYYRLPDAAGLARMVETRHAAIRDGRFSSPRTELVIADKGDDRLLGLATRYWESEETWWPGVGIVLFDPATWHAGRGAEALSLWCDYLFAALPRIARLDLRTWSGNGAMMALALKLGFKEGARFRRARIVDGQYYDGLGYGVLREEWDVRGREPSL